MNVVVGHGGSVQTVLLFWNGITCVCVCRFVRVWLRPCRGEGVRGERLSVQVCGCPQVGSNGYRCLFCTSLSTSNTQRKQTNTHTVSTLGGRGSTAHNSARASALGIRFEGKFTSLSAPWRVATVISSARFREVCSKQTKGRKQVPRGGAQKSNRSTSVVHHK